MNKNKEYARWCACADCSLQDELAAMDEVEIEEAFARDLAFGTGGLRGILGAGTNRMNVHTVAKASQGVADYVKAHFSGEKRNIAISYDSRILSEEFARIAAGVFAANGIQVWLYPELMPTPCLSFAVRELGCAAGVMVTASHNPARYNGYKVYGPDGCQITTEAAAQILGEIEKLDIFNDIHMTSFESARRAGLIREIPESVTEAFLSAIIAQSVLGEKDADKSIPIVYTPLNGTGRKPVLRALRAAKFTNVTVVEEQEMPDGRFPTCPYPNPEDDAALALGCAYAKQLNARLLIATDPDCDRLGVVVRTKDGVNRRLTGNEVGLLLLDYICARRMETDTMPDNPVLVKTIVTTSLAERIAERYGLQTIHVLTGFKYIGEQIGRLEKQGQIDSYVFGFEESCGYLSGTYVRDKDGVGAALQVCEMAAYYVARGTDLAERLEELYREYGYTIDTLRSWTFEGTDGIEQMRSIMREFRARVETLGGRQIVCRMDYAEGLEGLPKSDVLKLILADGSSVVIRPSGTEPKLKAYISASAETYGDAVKAEQRLLEDIADIVNAPHCTA